MTYESEILVDVPLEEFIHKMDNVENMKHWQRGLKSAEHLSGVPGELGSKMKLHYDFGNRKMDLIETVTKRNLPDEFHATYKAPGIQSIQYNYFEKVSEHQTRWVSKNEFMPLNFAMRVMLFLMPKSFKKQTMTYMKDFKNFAENGVSVANASA